MKRYSLFVLLFALPFFASAAVTVPWTATSTDKGGIAPALVNGNAPFLKIGSTGTSTFANGLSLTAGCVLVNGGCLGGGLGNVSTSSAETSGYYPAWTSTNGTPALLAGTSNIFQSGTNVGIGAITSLTTNLTLAGAGATFGTNGFGQFNIRNTTAGTDLGGGLVFSSTAGPHASIEGLSNAGAVTGYLSLYTNTGAALTEKLRISSAGNVGIGTTSPFQTLSVNGTGWFSGNSFHVGDTKNTLGAGPCTAVAHGCIELIGSDNTTAGITSIIQNTNAGTSAYTDLFLANDNPNSLANYSVVNLNSHAYSDTTFGTAFAVPDQLSVQNTAGPVTVAATGANQYINFVIGGNSSGAEAARLSTASGAAFWGVGTSTRAFTGDVFTITAGAGASTTAVCGNLGDATSKCQWDVVTDTGGTDCVYYHGATQVVQSGACTP